MRLKKSTKTMLLPQYMYSGNVTERWLDAMHTNSEISRVESIPRTTKFVHQEDLEKGALRYFVDNKAAMEDEFYEDLCNLIPSDKADWFIDTVANYWADGRVARDSQRVLELRESVRDLFNKERPRHVSRKYLVRNWRSGKVSPTLEVEDISAIVRVNTQNLYKHIHAWIESHENYDDIGLNNVYLRRGLCLEKRMNGGALYREWDYINSYSFALTIPEQFSQAGRGTVRAIVSSEYELFSGRVLFFSPFIRGLSAAQLEVGVIPARSRQRLVSQGKHGGIYEYVIVPW
jgi:hypothetical protein